jgi:dTDP-4-dehydrorhamnose reductase
MNIAIFGANGQLGQSFRKISRDIGEFSLFFTDVEQVDICKAQEVKAYLLDNGIDVIVNAAAYTAVEKAEEEEEIAWRLNAKAVSDMARTAKDENIFMIHISTDYVFDGKNHKPYQETDRTGPLSVYGKTKLAAEKAMLTSSVSGVILRTSWLYSEYGNNFLKTMLRLSQQRKEIEVVSDQIGTPTYATDLAGMIQEIIRQKDHTQPTKVYHFSNEGVASWYDFAVEIVRLTGNDCEIIPILSKDYKTLVQRPFYCVLDKQNIKSRYNWKIPHWRDSVKECLRHVNG